MPSYKIYKVVLAANPGFQVLFFHARLLLVSGESSVRENEISKEKVARLKKRIKQMFT